MDIDFSQQGITDDKVELVLKGLGPPMTLSFHSNCKKCEELMKEASSKSLFFDYKGTCSVPRASRSFLTI